MFVVGYQSLERIDTPTFKSIKKTHLGVAFWTKKCRDVERLGVGK